MGASAQRRARRGRALLRAIYRDADAVVAYGRHVASFARRNGARRVAIAPQAVDGAFWSGPPEGLPWRRGAEFAAVFVGRDEPGKGLDVLLDAWSRVRLEPPSAVLALVGVEGVPGAVGRQPPPSVRNFLATADVLVVPRRTSTFREPWGLVVNEAMHAGTPVIATDQVEAAAGGLVRNARNGLVVPAEDPAALGSALRLLRDDAELRARLGTAAREDVAPYTYAAWAEGFAGAPASVTPMRLSLVLLVLLLVPASAAASGRDVLRDCADDEVLSRTYTQREYREALSKLATDSSEYPTARASSAARSSSRPRDAVGAARAAPAPTGPPAVVPRAARQPAAARRAAAPPLLRRGPATRSPR